jgi:hypothetical protein
MKNQSYPWITLVLLLVSGLHTGCRPKEPPQKKGTLVWQGADSGYIHTSEVNHAATSTDK